MILFVSFLLPHCSKEDGGKPEHGRVPQNKDPKNPAKPQGHDSGTAGDGIESKGNPSSDESHEGSSDSPSASEVESLPKEVTLPSYSLGYPSVSSIQSTIKSWAEKAPTLAKYGEFGQDGRFSSFYLRISKAVGQPKMELPRVLVTAATHGDEHLSTGLLLGYMHKFLGSYGKDDSITELIDSRDIYFVPVVCPGGYSRVSRFVEGVDPNRVYPYPDEPTLGFMPACISNTIKFFEEKKFNATLDYHNYGGMVMFPWSYTSYKVEQNLFVNYMNLAKELGQISGYQRVGPVATTIYKAKGTSIDYYHWFGQDQGWNTCSFAIEAGSSKRPPVSAIKGELDRNYHLINHFINKAPVLFMSTYGLYNYTENDTYQPWTGKLADYPFPKEEF